MEGWKSVTKKGSHQKSYDLNKDGSYHNAKIYKTEIEKRHDRTKICLKKSRIIKQNEEILNKNLVM